MSFNSMFEDALDKKYSIMQQGATTDRLRADAAMVGANRIGLGGGGGGSDIAPVDPLAGMKEQLMRAQITQAQSGTALNTANADAISSQDLRTQKDFRSAPSGQLTVDDAKAMKNAKSSGGLTSWFGSLFGAAEGTASVPKSAAKPLPKGFAKIAAGTPGKGMSKVPGKGSGKVDKVPAVLAPGEAVLNKGAAKIAGRGLISALNKLGAQKMGMT